MDFGPRKSTVPAITRAFAGSGGVRSRLRYNRDGNQQRQALSLPSSLTGSLSQGRSFAEVGAAQGPLGVFSEVLGRAGKALMEYGYEEHKQSILAEAKTKGMTEGERAFLEGRALQLRDDRTLASAAFNKSIVQAYGERLELDVSQRIDKLKQDHPDDVEAFGKKFDEMTEAYLKNLPADMQPGFRTGMNQERDRALKPIRERVLKRAEGEANATHMMAMDKAAEEAANTARNLGRMEEGDASFAETHRRSEGARRSFMDALDARTDLTPQAKAKILSKYEDLVRRHSILGGFEQDLAQGADAGRKFIADFRGMEQLVPDPDEREALANEMEGMLRDRLSEDKAAQAEAKAKADGQYGWWMSDNKRAAKEGTLGRAQIEHLRSQGAFRKPGDYDTLLAAIDKREEDEQERRDILQRGNGALAGTVRLDPGDKGDRKAADEAYKARLDEIAVAGVVPEEAERSTLREVAGRTGIVPESAKAEIRRLMQGGPDQVARGAALIGEIENIDPSLLGKGISKTTAARARLINGMVRSGVDPVMAIERADKLTDPANRVQREAREEAFKKLAPIKTDDVADLFDEGWLPWQTDPDVPEEVEADALYEANELFRREYLLTGNEDGAREYALNMIGHTWGTTEEGGSRRLARLPDQLGGRDTTLAVGDLNPEQVAAIGSLLEDADLDVDGRNVSALANAYAVGGDAGVMTWLKGRGVDLSAFTEKRRGKAAPMSDEERSKHAGQNRQF